MANLPDLDTSTLRLTAYWNALNDGGLSDIDPMDVVSASEVDTYTTYDNGVEGVTNDGYNFRVKEDGWFVAYTDTTDLGAHQEYVVNGPYSFISSLSSPSNATVSDTSNELEDLIKSLRDELSSSGNYSAGDVAYYNFQTPDATNVTIGHSKSSYSSRYTYDVKPGTSTTLHSMYLVGGAYDTDYGQDGDPVWENAAIATFPETTLYAINVSRNDAHGQAYLSGARDVLANTTINTGTTYTAAVETDDKSSGSRCSCAVVTFWS